MRIITWNCNMAFRKKADHILAYHPDILVVPECEHPDKLKFNPGIQKPNDVLWFGSNQHKGIGIFSYGDFTFKLLDTYDPAFKMIIPIEVSGGEYDFTLYAIWANNPTDPDGQYIEQVWKAIKYYDNSITNKQTILIGDFNSNTIWDRKSREGNHSTVVKYLEDKGIFSCYHKHYNQLQGKEEHPTLYLYRHQDKSYHIDYCFVSADLSDNIQSVVVGDYDSWKQYSDHVPVMVTFN